MVDPFPSAKALGYYRDEFDFMFSRRNQIHLE